MEILHIDSDISYCCQS